MRRYHLNNCSGYSIQHHLRVLLTDHLAEKWLYRLILQNHRLLSMGSYTWWILGSRSKKYIIPEFVWKVYWLVRYRRLRRNSVLGVLGGRDQGNALDCTRRRTL